tara:strand:+ start:274 stop:516 length:243 start_codon:yes stop_codon:yes gene_type:complete
MKLVLRFTPKGKGMVRACLISSGTSMDACASEGRLRPWFCKEPKSSSSTASLSTEDEMAALALGFVDQQPFILSILFYNF